MAHSQFHQFLEEAAMRDRDSGSTLDPDPLYGLYTRWCHVTRNPPRTESSFWTAMKNRLGTGSNGLPMTGPAAADADYILASYPGLV